MPRSTSHRSGGEQALTREETERGGQARAEGLSPEVVRDTDRTAARDTLIEALLDASAASQETERVAVLLRTDQRGCGQLVELSGDRIRLGRSWDVEARCEDDSVSRFHAEIAREAGGYRIVDSGSANGTFVDGRRVQSCTLSDGVVVRLGSRVTFRFSVLDEDERHALSYLHELGHFDPLTRVYNRRYLAQYLAGELAFAQRHHTELSVILFDIDHFKQVNDKSGHVVGDRVLARVAQVARAQCRTEDVVARYGGEEFVIVLRQTPVEGAVALAERIRRVVAETPMAAASDQPVRVSLSAGCASLDCVSSESSDALIRLADRRLYRAKEDGRNRVVATEPRLRSVPPPSTRACSAPPELEEAAPVSRVQTVERTARAFEQLDDELKMVVGLRYQENCSVAEIAAVLDTSEDWVTERLLRAMQVLSAA